MRSLQQSDTLKGYLVITFAAVALPQSPSPSVQVTELIDTVSIEQLLIQA
jgi:hypothetical protein